MLSFSSKMGYKKGIIYRIIAKLRNSALVDGFLRFKGKLVV